MPFTRSRVQPRRSTYEQSRGQIRISCRQFQHPFGAARFGRGDFNRKTSFNRFAKILHELIHAVALRSIARNGGDFGPEAALLSLMHDDSYLHYSISTLDCLADTRQVQVLLTPQPYSAACAFTSADTWRMARASCSAGCAPDTAYFCANTKVGTPEIPLSEASFACAEISSTSSSLASRLRTSSASSPISAATRTSTLVSVRSPPSLKYNSISRCFISADLPFASAQ